MLTWTKNNPTSMTFTAVDQNGQVAYTANLNKTGPSSSTLQLLDSNQGNVGGLNIPGDFNFAKELLSGIGNSI